MDPKTQFLPVFLPSFFLLAAASAPIPDTWNQHLEVFGSDHYYLTLRFAGDPQGVLSPAGPIPFSGTLVTAAGEFRLRGQRLQEGDQWVYRIATQQGEFEGRRSAQTSSCQRLGLRSLSEPSLPAETLSTGECF